MSDEIRREVLAAGAELTAASKELDLVLGRQEAYRSSRIQLLDSGAAAPSSPDGWEKMTPAEAFRWFAAETPEEEEYWKALRSDNFRPERSRLVRARERLFSEEFQSAIARLRAGDASSAEHAIAYLEADPWHFHSGYLKQKLARYLRRIALTESQAERLRTAILTAIQKGRREDLKEYTSLGRRVDSPSFRAQLARLVAGADEGTRYRAQRILDACRHNDAR